MFRARDLVVYSSGPRGRGVYALRTPLRSGSGLCSSIFLVFCTYIVLVAGVQIASKRLTVTRNGRGPGPGRGEAGVCPSVHCVHARGLSSVRFFFWILRCVKRVTPYMDRQQICPLIWPITAYRLVFSHTAWRENALARHGPPTPESRASPSLAPRAGRLSRVVHAHHIGIVTTT